MPALSRRVSIVTPLQRVSSLDHLVTQWMSVVSSVCGSARISSQLQDARISPLSSMLNVHSLRGVLGVGPADSTGKPFSTYCPGGIGLDGLGRLRPKNPRVTMPPRFTLPADQLKPCRDGGGLAATDCNVARNTLSTSVRGLGYRMRCHGPSPHSKSSVATANSTPKGLHQTTALL